MNNTEAVSFIKPQDMVKSRELASHFFSEPEKLPISFVFDGKAICGIPEEWNPVSNRRRIDANIIETVFEGNDSETGMNVRVEYTEYQDYPVIEWVAWFTNKGHEPAPAIRDALAADWELKGASPILDHGNGDFYSGDGYTPCETPLHPGETITLAPNGGRPCDGAFPYFRLIFEGGGLSLAIGWPAQWSAGFSAVTDGVRVQAGQEKTDIRLLPGESIRTPRITVLSWTGGVSRAVNLWRRWYLTHILPRSDGQPMKPLLACAAPDEGEEFTAATEENQLRYMEKFKQRGIYFDVWWIDAGWYPCYDENQKRKWPITGSWVPDSERFPKGLKPVSDRAKQDGADLLLWFEPERVRPGTNLMAEHPEWLLSVKGVDDELLTKYERQNRLLNLGIPECRRWLTEHLCRLIADNGIGIYRQDFNFEPLRYWRSNDLPDRSGMNENLHVQGYLKFWDDLLKRNPGLWLDSCASGGRRNDLETMRRSVPLHYTDYGYGEHPVKLAFHHTMYSWIPYFKEGTHSWDIGGYARFSHKVDSFSYHCAMAPMLFPALDIRRDDYDYALAKKMIGIWRRASNLVLYGDYYSLIPLHRNALKWVALQFDLPETGNGFVQGIRLPESPEETVTIHPVCISPDSVYLFENEETGEKKDISGEELIRDGITLALPKRSGAIWFYKKKSEQMP
ncbi:MAG: hypothetical protein HN368_19525 [Spirochaetales bacterium]|nr:hypothetical protein [Spirochaetales bacterium]